MKSLVEAILSPARMRVHVHGPTEHIAMLLEPRRIVHLRHQGLKTAIRGIITVVKTHGIEAVPEDSQLGQQAYGPLQA